MLDTITQGKAERTLARLLPRLTEEFADYAQANPDDWATFLRRLGETFPRLFGLLLDLYSTQYDFFYHMERLLSVMASCWIARSPDLKALDRSREANPDWFQSNEMLGGVLYVDLFAGDLTGVRAKIPYFKELGLTYLHLMPFFKVPPGESDGGYAVSSYREVHLPLGTMEQLADLAAELRREGISLTVDLVFNHTALDHEWALKARAGDANYEEYYRIFPDRTMPDRYELTMREIFPDEHPGAFTYEPEMGKWVWTTFHSYQWDLNYANPAVFNAMAEEMLFLANQGVEVLRLDAVAFIWKQMGTSSENLPEAHLLIQAFNAVARIAAPALLFKSEAIVHPDDVVRYIRSDECQISYNPLLMALLWNSLATREVRLLRQALRERHRLPPGCAWVNYVRVHDDIGWTFSDEDAERLGISGYDHRRFLNDFYTGRFEGSFSRGLPFQENPKTGDCRISGTCASLAGLEKALAEEGPEQVELAIRRIALIHGIIMTVGGIPLLYLGDEVGTLNDYSFQDDETKARDSRWVHRPATNWDSVALRNDPHSIQGRVYERLRHLIEVRKTHVAFTDGDLQVIETGNDHVLGYVRQHGKRGGGYERVLVFANFSERTQTLPAHLLRLYGLSYAFKELISGRSLPSGEVTLEPLSLMALVPEKQPVAAAVAG
ncbi:MAG: alpha-amylase family glycosyl hydrolase [Anaerolineae bacterium]